MADRPSDAWSSTVDNETLSENLSKSAFFEGVGHFERKFQMEEGVAHQPLLVSEN